MITELFLKAVGAVLSFVAGLMPDLPAPAGVLGDAGSAWGQLVGYMAGVASWFPFDVALACVTVVAGLAAAAGGVKLVRIAGSFMTGGGGSAA